MDTGIDQEVSEDTTVSFEDAAAELENEEKAIVEEVKEEDVLEVLVPKAEPKVWQIGPEDYRREYVQRPLSFIGKMQWFALVGDVLDKAMSGPNGLNLGNLFTAPDNVGNLRPEDFREADTFVQAIGKLLAVAPDFLVKSYCIWLNVPDYEKDMMEEIMKLSPDQGGLTDDQGIEIIEVFIDQNYEALDVFFREKFRGLVNRVQARAKDAQADRA